MVVGILRITIDVPESQSLKDKRAVIRSLKAKIDARFPVSVAEVGDLGARQLGELGVAYATHSSAQADSMLSKVADFSTANCSDGYVSGIDTEVIHLG